MLPFIFIETAGQISQSDICIEINGQAVDFTTSESGISIHTDCTFGLHRLTLTSVNPIRLEILQVFVNGSSLRKMLYMSWIKNLDHEKFQPGTVLWEAGQTWHLPFGYPVSYWLELAENKFSPGELGTNLYEKYWIYYPDSMTVDSEKFPNIIRDFFLHNFNYTVVPKETTTAEQIPYMWYKKSIPHSLVELAGQEAIKNIGETTNSSAHLTENQKEFRDKFNSNWDVTWLYKYGKRLPCADDYPHVQKIIDLLDLDCWSVFIGKLSPGDFIYPHVDNQSKSNPEYENYQGCTQLYVPLVWPAGNFIKIAGAGILPMDEETLVINNDTFTHSVINASTQTRYALGLRVNKKIIHDCFIK